jgi:hypothetical protein
MVAPTIHPLGFKMSLTFVLRKSCSWKLTQIRPLQVRIIPSISFTPSIYCIADKIPILFLFPGMKSPPSPPAQKKRVVNHLSEIITNTMYKMILEEKVPSAELSFSLQHLWFSLWQVSNKDGEILLNSISCA